jgi:hypothetical protein
VDANSSLGIPFGKDVRGPRSPSGHPAVHSRYAEWREAKRTKSHVFRRAAQTSDHGPARRRTRTAKHRTASENVLMGRMSEPADISQPLWPRNGEPRGEHLRHAVFLPQKDLRNQRLSESATVRSHWGHRVYSLGIPFGKDVRGPRSPSGHPAVHSRYAEWKEAKRTKSHVFRRAAQTSDHGPARRRTRTAKHRTASENVLMGRMSEPADISQPLWPRNGHPD